MVKRGRAISWLFLVASLFYVGSHFQRKILPDTVLSGSEWNDRAYLDFDCYLEASRNLVAGQSLYRPSTTTTGEPSCTAADLPEYVYPPTLAVILLPLTNVDPCVAEQGWFLLNVLACLALVPLLLIALRIPCRPWTVGIAIFLVGAPMATLENLTLGQINLYLLVALVGAWVLLEKNRGSAAVSLIVLAALLKLIPILFGLELVRRRLWRPVLWGAAAGLALFLVLFALAPADGLVDFVVSIGTKSNQDIASPNNASVQAALARAFNLAESQVRVVNIGVGILTLAIALFPLRAKFDSRDHRWLLALYPALCLALTPRLETHHLVLLYPALLLLLHSALVDSPLRTGLPKTIGVILVFIFLNSRGFHLPDFFPQIVQNFLKKPAGFALWCLIPWLLTNWHRSRIPEVSSGSVKN